MPDFATSAEALVTPMTTSEMEDGLECGSININRLNWLFQQLFSAQPAYVDCNGAPIDATAALASCADLAAAIAAIPTDTFLQGLQTYDAVTNVMTLLMSDGTTVAVDMTGLVGDAVATAIASIPQADGSETLIVGTGAITLMGNGTTATPYSIGINLSALAAALCANTTFQACIASLTSGTPVAPSVPTGSPFTDTNIQGALMSITHGTFTGTAPITLSGAGLPAGVVFTDNSDGTYTLTGTWPAAGTYTYEVTATNVAGSATSSGNELISTAAAVAPIPPVGAPFTDTGTAGTAI